MGKRDMTVAARTPANSRDERTLSDYDVGAAPTLRAPGKKPSSCHVSAAGSQNAVYEFVLYGFENRSVYIIPLYIDYIILHRNTRTTDTVVAAANVYGLDTHVKSRGGEWVSSVSVRERERERETKKERMSDSSYCGIKYTPESDVAGPCAGHLCAVVLCLLRISGHNVYASKSPVLWLFLLRTRAAVVVVVFIIMWDLKFLLDWIIMV